MRSASFLRCSGVSTSAASPRASRRDDGPRVRPRDLLGAQSLDGGAVDGRLGEQLDRPLARRQHFLAEGQKVLDGFACRAGKPVLLLRRGVEPHGEVPHEALGAPLRLLGIHRPAHEAVVAEAMTEHALAQARVAVAPMRPPASAIAATTRAVRRRERGRRGAGPAGPASGGRLD